MADTRVALNEFFIGVQKKALRHIEFSIGDKDEALDILQDAMMKLAKNYSMHKEDWPKLFQRIIHNLVIDWHRRKKTRAILFWWQQAKDTEPSQVSSTDFEFADLSAPEMATQESNRRQLQKISNTLSELPMRQQQAFTLRAWWGHDTKETAYIMNCSEGSVKTHYSRALTKIKASLGGCEP